MGIRGTLGHKLKNFRWLWLSGFVFIADQVIKFIVEAKMNIYEEVFVLPFFSWTLIYNSGAAFGFLSDASGWQWWFLSIVSIVVSVVLVLWLYRLKRCQKVQSCAIALVLGGALGNLYDRLVYGQVVDFILVHYNSFYFPAFNLADSAITVGAFIFFLDYQFVEKDK